MRLDFAYVRADRTVDAAKVSIAYAQAYRRWFNLMFDFESVAPHLAEIFSYRPAEITEAARIDSIRIDIQRVLKQPEVCPWGGGMEARIRNDLARLSSMLEEAKSLGIGVRTSGYPRPRGMLVYTSLPDGTLDEAYAMSREPEFRDGAEALLARLGQDSMFARVWVHESTELAAADAVRLALEFQETRDVAPQGLRPFLDTAIGVCSDSVAGGYGIHIADGSGAGGNDLMVYLLRRGERDDSLHPGINAALVQPPAEYAVSHRVWDYADNTVRGEELVAIQHELRALWSGSADFTDAHRSDFRQVAFLARLARKHGLDLHFSGP
jgi:hypothetical protein